MRDRETGEGGDVWAGVADSLQHRYRLHLVQVKDFAGLAPEANEDGPVSAPEPIDTSPASR